MATATIGLGLCLSLPAGAQPAPQAGGRVRLVTKAGPSFRGVYLRLIADSLELSLDDSRRRIRVAGHAIRRLDLSRGRGTAAGRGAIVGGLIGVGAGVALALTAPAGEVTTGQLLVVAPLGFGVIGGALGFFFGSFTTIEKWGPGAVPVARTGMGTTGWAVGIRVPARFR